MLTINEILEIIKIRQRIDGKLVPRTEEYINKHTELKTAILFYTKNIHNTTLCDRIYYILKNITNNNTCVCGKNISIHKKYCSSKCSSNSESTREKYKQTCINSTGYDNISKVPDIKKKISKKNKENYKNKKEEIISKREATNTQLYGVSSYSKTEEYKEKYKQTCIESFGVDNSFKSIIVKEKILQDKIDNPDKYKNSYQVIKKTSFKINFNKGLMKDENTIPLFTEDDWELDYSERKFICTICNKEFFQTSLYTRRCTHCYPLERSKAEIDIINFLKKCNINNIIENSRRVIPPYELDIYIPNINLAIEYNGIMYHSFGHNKSSMLNNIEKENSNYHLNKTEKCNLQHIKLLHIFENEWIDSIKQEIWKSIIKSKLGLNKSIGARECIITGVSKENVKSFLTENHLQGNCASSIELGLYHQNELVSLLTISKSRFNKNYNWEITRFCNKIGFNVIGGFSRLLKEFRSKYEGSIITYADKRYSTGDMYKKSGFIELPDSKPNYFYFINDKKYQLHSRIEFQKHKLKDKLETFDPDKTEAQNMFENGYRRIWDCGNKVFGLE